MGAAATTPFAEETVQRTNRRRLALLVVAVAAAVGASGVQAYRSTVGSPDYGVGAVPLAVPWLAAALAVAVALLGLTRTATSLAAGVLVALLIALTGWSDGALLFDALRIVRLVPLPLDGSGFALRLLLLIGASAAALPVVQARQAVRGRCPACRRWRAGPLARIPRWPAILGVLFALPYPVLRVAWLLGSTVGTTGRPVDVDPTLQLAMACAGTLLVAIATVLALDRGPAWLRGLLGFAGVAVGGVLAVTFAPGAMSSVAGVIENGLAWSPASDLRGWVFALFYASWTVAGIGIAVGGLRYWIRRRARCATCWPVRI